MTDSVHYCPNMLQPGGCHLHNLQCGYPECDKPPEVEPLTPEQVAAGFAEARRIIEQAVGYHFGGVVIPFAPELKSLALSALSTAESEIQRLTLELTDADVTVSEAIAALETMRSRLESAEASAALATEALNTYGDHYAYCRAHDCKDCDCGYADMKKRIDAARNQEGA